MKRVLQFGLEMYKRFLSPMLPHSCRFVPTCSEYAMDAIERYGALRGSWLAIGRLLRCHPFAPAGYDPVPLKPVAGRLFGEEVFRAAKRTGSDAF
jgi:putative membrane protein insertion efficiency factor